MKRIFISGHNGYVGKELIKRGFLPLECDITDWMSVEKAVKYAKPHLVLHLAAKSNIDWCEDKRNQEEVIKTNVRGTYNVFEVLSNAKIPGVLLSSDHIWKGGLFETHKEYSRPTLPVNFYGTTKAAAEGVARSFDMKIVRSSYLFDSHRLEREIEDLKIGHPRMYPIFIKRSFLYLQDFCDMLEKYCVDFHRMPEVLHLSGSVVTSWYSFVRQIAWQYGYSAKSVKPKFFDSKKFVPRPHNGGLNMSLSHSLGFAPKDFMDGIERMKNEG